MATTRWHEHTLSQDEGPSLAVPRSLRGALASVRGESSASGPGERPLVRLPECDAQLVVHVTPRGALRAHVAGPRTFAKYRRIVPGPFYIQLVLQPDVARAVLGVPLHELCDRVVDLEEVWGRRAGELLERVAPVRDHPQAAVLAVEDLLVDRLRTRSRTGAAALARRAAEVLRANPAGATVHGLAAHLGASERSLRQAFLDHIGTSPKRFARIARVRRVIAAAGTASWARLAAEHDFCDQPHLSGEFRALLGVSPRQWLTGQLPFVRPASSPPPSTA